MSKFATKKRTEIGSNQIKKLRAQGFIPAVAYASHSKTYEISIPAIEFEKFIGFNEVGSKVKIKVGRSYEDAVLKDFQRDPVSRKVLHVDFQLLKAGESIKLKIPVHVKGREAVEDKRTIVQEMIHELEIVAMPKNLIDHIDIDITGKVVGDMMTVADVVALLPEGIELTEELDKVIVVVASKTISEEPEEGEDVDSGLSAEPLEVL
jgi:large subunit ribosomal protein L25